MPAGDAQRVWFPEMVWRLRAEWRDGLSFLSLVELRDTLESMLWRIRSDRAIHPPVFKCPVCGRAGPASEPRISVRAVILSLARFEIASGEQVKTVMRAWAAYRKANGLDLYGRATGTKLTGNDCVHPDVR